MTMRTDIFGMAPRQHDMFGAPQESFDLPMTPEEIRAELTEAVALLRRSDELPWSIALTLRIVTMFPDIAAKLPEPEAAVLVQEFNSEIRRLRREAA